MPEAVAGGNGWDALLRDVMGPEVPGAPDESRPHHPSAAWSDHPARGSRSSRRVAASDRAEAADRAFLLQLYNDLVGPNDGPVVPFPVELVAGEDEAPELDTWAEVVDLAAFRARRCAPGAEAHSTGS